MSTAAAIAEAGKTPRLVLPAPHRTGAAGSFPADCLKRPSWAFSSADGGGPLDAPSLLPSGSVSWAYAWMAWFPKDPPTGWDAVKREQAS